MRRGFACLAIISCSACPNDLPDFEGDGSSTTTTSLSTTGAADSSDGVGDTTTGNLDTTATEEGTQTSTTGPQPECYEEDGTFEMTCSGTAPFCVDGECVPCSTDESQTMCPDELVCDRSGVCVVCTAEVDDACGGMTPYCDPETHTCVPCTEHAHCGESACNLFTGACVGGVVVNAGPAQQYTTLNNAVNAVVAAGGEGTVIVHPGLYNESVTVVGAGVVIAFLASPGTPPDWQRTSGPSAPQLRANENAMVLVDGIVFRLNSSASEAALRADDSGRLWVDRSRIGQNSGVGVRAEVNADLVLRNSFLAGANNLAALSVLDSNASIRYSTVLGNLGNSRAVACDATGSVSVSDSILLTLGSLDEVTCDGITVETTATTMALPGSTMVVEAEAGWFESPATGDLHLTEAGEPIFVGIAIWDDGDPLVDIDGQPRSGLQDTMEHAGADFIP